MKRAAAARVSTHKRNRGAVMLAQTGETQAKIAKRVKCSRVEVAYFESGQRLPGPINRARFKTEYGIPETAWNESPAPRLAAEPPPVDSIVGGLQRSIGEIQAQILADETMTSRERLRELQTAISALQSLAELTGESDSEERLLRLPVMRRLVDKILKALEPWPEAMRAAGEALKGDNDDIDEGAG